MANPATDQNQQLQINPQEPKVDDVKSLSRRSWLRNAAITATSAVMLLLVLNSCTKEKWDDVKGQVPGGGLGSTPDTWYRLKVTYRNENNARMPGYMGPVAENFDGRLFWDYMKIDNDHGWASKFRLHPTTDGWAYWEIDDGYWLSLRATGWAYRSYEGNRVEWKIVDGKLYTKYWKSDWQNYPLGCELRGFLGEEEVYFVGVDLGDANVLTNCELVPAP